MASCELCENDLDLDDPTIFYQVAEWVSGPKRHGAVLRQYTEKVAHAECIQKVMQGQSPDQEPLF